MTTIATFTTPEEAHLFRMWLESQGVAGFVQDEHFVQLFWHYSQAIGGVRVMVADTDFRVAAEAYSDYMSKLRSGPYPLRPVRAWAATLLVSMLIGIPVLICGRRASRETAPAE